MTRWLVLLLALAGCETDDFFITDDGSDDCPTDTGETTSDATSTTSTVMPEPLAEIITVPTPPPDPTLPGVAPAQEPL